MPLNANRLAKKINSEISKKIKKKFKGAKPGKNMKKFSKAIAIGVVKSIKGKRGKIRPPAGTGGIGRGIKGLKPKRLSSAMIKHCKKAFKSQGPALKSITEPMAKAIVGELGKASVKGTNGGTAKKFSGWSVGKMAGLMAKKSGFKKTKENKKLFKALSQAITDEIKKYGKSKIPRTGPGSGPGIATIS